MGKDVYKVKRLRDGAILTLDTSHALKLLRLDAGNSKKEFELAETNYTFSENEIHRTTSSRNTEKPKEQSKD